MRGIYRWLRFVTLTPSGVGHPPPMGMVYIGSYTHGVWEFGSLRFVWQIDIYLIVE